MSASEWVFFACAALTLAAALASVTERDGGRAFAWLGVAIAFASGAVLPYGAASIAVTMLGVGGATAFLGLIRLGRGAPTPWRQRVASLKPGRLGVGGLLLTVTWGVLAFALVGTMARQYVTFGAQLERRPAYGEVVARDGTQGERAGFILHTGALLLLFAPLAVGLARPRKEDDA